MAAITSATSLVSTGEVLPLAKGSRIVSSLAIDSAAQSRKNGCCRKTVGLTCTTGSPDQLNTCSPSQWRRCCVESVIFVRLICDAVICEIFTKASRSSSSRAAAAAMTVASRYDSETLIPKYKRRQPAITRETSSARVKSPITTSAPSARNALERSSSRRTKASRD